MGSSILTSAWMSTWAATLVSRGRNALMLLRRNRQEWATAAISAEFVIHLHAHVPRSLSWHHHGVVMGDGQISVRGPFPIEEHKLSLVQVEL